MSPPTPSPLLSAQQLSCERGGISLFAGLDFSVSAGELLQVIGPNGSGKTSLLRILAGLSASYTGSIVWHTTVESVASPFLYLGHRIGLKALLSPLENLRWYTAAQKISDEEILRALAHWQLRGYEHQPCYQLSSGQQQRVALARLLLSPAKLWLLDEPFTAIDAEGVAQLENVLWSHVIQGGAVVLTTHHPFRQREHLRYLTLHVVQEYA